MEKEEEKQCIDKLEEKLVEVYNIIPDCAQEMEVTIENNI
jgi:hypothetical protein